MVKLLEGEGLRPMLNHNSDLWISNYGRVFSFEFKMLIEVHSIIVKDKARIEIHDQYHNLHINLNVQTLMRMYWPEPLAFTILEKELELNQKHGTYNRDTRSNNGHGV